MLPEMQVNLIDRHAFSELFCEVFKGPTMSFDDYLDIIYDIGRADDVSNQVGDFLIYDENDDWYIINLKTGLIVGWYKLTHIGRANFTNDPTLTLEDLRKIFCDLKIAIDVNLK